jgi:hydroxymethylbilane synthase
MKLRVGTRGSLLARTQTGHVIDALRAAHADLDVETIVIRTSGDDRSVSPADLSLPGGGKGLFVKEIEEALLAGRIDLAVHSLKDMPGGTPPGLILAATPVREDPRDALIAAPGSTLATLPVGSRIGTSSVRRTCQLRARRPDLEFVPMRGNVDTRLRKLHEGAADAIVLAAAGLRRLGRTAEITELLAVDDCLPAIGQGILALETRREDAPTRALVEVLEDAAAARAASAERAFLETAGGDCTTPLSAHAYVCSGALRVDGFVASPDGARFLRDSVRTTIDTDLIGAAAAGRLLAQRLLDAGGAALLGR